MSHRAPPDSEVRSSTQSTAAAPASAAASPAPPRRGWPGRRGGGLRASGIGGDGSLRAMACVAFRSSHSGRRRQRRAARLGCRHARLVLRHLRRRLPAVARAARALPDLRGRAPVRRLRRPALDHGRRARRRATGTASRRSSPACSAIGADPSFAIGQRALVDGRPAVGLRLAARRRRRGAPGRDGCARSRSRTRTTTPAMVEWAERFDARILLHEADRELGDAPDRAHRALVGRAPGASTTTTSSSASAATSRAAPSASGAAARAARRPALRRHRPGRRRPRLGQLHVQLPEPDPAAGGARSSACAA